MIKSKRLKIILIIFFVFLFLTVVNINKPQDTNKKMEKFEEEITSYDNDYSLEEKNINSSGLIKIANSGEKIVTKGIEIVTNIFGRITKRFIE